MEIERPTIQGPAEDDDNDCICLDESFFVNESYETRTFAYGSHVLRLLCLQSASSLPQTTANEPSVFGVHEAPPADYDLTGQLVWPGAELLNYHLAQNTDFLTGCSVIELGSGVGVTGLLCSRFCRQVVMTDHNDIVLKVLKQNIGLQSPAETSSYAEIMSEKLEWGNYNQLLEILEKFPEGFDLVLGADICFQQCSIPLLFDTVERLLEYGHKRCSKFILGYVSRAKSIDTMVAAEAEKHGLKMHEIQGTRAMVAGGSLEGVIFEFVLH